MIRKRSTPSVILGCSSASRQRRRPAELQQVVVRVGRVVDLEGESAHAPVVLELDRAAVVGDRLLDVGEDLARRSSSASVASRSMRS